MRLNYACPHPHFPSSQPVVCISFVYRRNLRNRLDNGLGICSMRSTNAREAEVVLDLGRYELRRAGHRVKLEKKPMELLIFLAARREQLVPREEIVKKLWRSDLFIDTERN